jgi:glycosyltransferase involved in cell wall biosynthesis
MHAERGFPRPMECLPNFIDRVDREWQSPAPRPHERPYFLFVGRLEALKGLQTLIALWKRVPECDLLVAGTGTYEVELRAMAVGNSRIRFLGGLPPNELGPLYYHAIACIVPSLTFETFGLTSVEAFARKTPAVVRDLGALPEIVQDSGGGFIYRTDEELLDALKRLAESPKLRGELGQKGYDGLVRWWCREAHLRLYFDCLNDIAKEKFGSIPWGE